MATLVFVVVLLGATVHKLLVGLNELPACLTPEGDMYICPG